MRSKYLLTVTLLVTAAVAVIVVIAATAILAGTIPWSRNKPEEQAVQTKPTEVKTEVRSPNSSAANPTPSMETPFQDGGSLVQSRCAQCHDLQWLQQVKKTRMEWETTLSRMEWFNVKLGKAEKTVLLDYLAHVDEP